MAVEERRLRAPGRGAEHEEGEREQDDAPH